MTPLVANELEHINKLIFVKKYDEAWRRFHQIIENDPTAASALIVHLRRVELASKLKKLTELFAEYERKLEKNPQDKVSETCLLLVEMHGNMLTPEEAVARFQNVLRDNPESAVGYYGVAFSLELQGNIERAIFNYEKSITCDENWYPSYFGLSQLNYQKGDTRRGDQYFLIFEKAAPYNIYGNFETHRKLSKEFLENESYDAAEAAITTLSEWWIENKGQCPPEIQIHEHLTVSRIFALKGDALRAEARKAVALSLCEQVLNDAGADEGIVYFIARTLEEFADFELALRFYKKALKIAGNNPSVVQKIGGQFLSLGEYQLALDLFSEAYLDFPDNAEIRFCILVSKLKLADLNVEEYLIGKERLKQLIHAEGDRVEVLALLHSLLAKFQEDPDVHMHIGDVYLRLGNVEKAGRHFKKMHELDPMSRTTGLRYISYHMHHGDSDIANQALEKIASADPMSISEDTEVFWLRANYFARKGEFLRSQEFLNKALMADPWNVSYVVLQITNLTEISELDLSLKGVDPTLEKLSRMDEAQLDWAAFEAVTDRLESERVAELVYARRKLRFLYSDGDEGYVHSLVLSACVYDAQKGTYDFLRLMNTNFDSPSVYWALGTLHKELWQLEVASMWLEQTLLCRGLTSELKALCLIEIADCHTWLGRNLAKGIEYAKLALDLGLKDAVYGKSVLSHAYIKSGLVKLAETHLAEQNIGNFDMTFLKGLIEYRNGARRKANEIWKPLLSIKSESIRAHTIKQEILKFYFDGAPYLKVN